MVLLFAVNCDSVLSVSAKLLGLLGLSNFISASGGMFTGSRFVVIACCRAQVV